jgi:hypothetical protein
VQDRVLRNEPLDGLGLQATGGRVDLRYMPFPADLGGLVGVGLRGVDLSGAKLGNLRLVDSVVENCVFDRADCQYWHLRGSSVNDCSFVGADLRYATLGEWFDGKGNTYRRVRFVSTRFLRSSTRAATYEDCDFSNAELDRVNFWQSSLIRCTFAGPVRDVVFDGRMLGEGKPDGNPMDHVDFSDAALDGCEFRGLRLDSVKLPADPALFRIRDVAVIARAEAALARAGNDPQAALVAIVLGHARETLATGGDALINARDAGPAGEVVAALLRKAAED